MTCDALCQGSAVIMPEDGRRLGGPCPGKAAAMDKVKRCTSAEPIEPPPGAAGRHRIRFVGRQGVEREEGVEGKRGVVQIGSTVAVRIATIGEGEPTEKRGHQLCRFTQRPFGQPGHLDHLESPAHAEATGEGAASPAARAASRFRAFVSCSRQ